MDPLHKSHAIRKLLLFSRTAQHNNDEVTFKESYKAFAACFAVANIPAYAPLI